jgi:hypothetical protein
MKGVRVSGAMVSLQVGRSSVVEQLCSLLVPRPVVISLI